MAGYSAGNGLWSGVDRLTVGTGLSISSGLSFGGFGTPPLPPGMLVWGANNGLMWGANNFLLWG